jgi:hypothetical protein
MFSDEEPAAVSPSFVAGLAAPSSGRNDASGYVDIVKADNRDIAGHRYTVPRQFGNETECHLVGLAEHGTGPLVESSQALAARAPASRLKSPGKHGPVPLSGLSLSSR